MLNPPPVFPRIGESPNSRPCRTDARSDAGSGGMAVWKKLALSAGRRPPTLFKPIGQAEGLQRGGSLFSTFYIDGWQVRRALAQACLP